jgi:transcriptional regulator with XRE-family HTH domain
MVGLLAGGFEDPTTRGGSRPGARMAEVRGAMAREAIPAFGELLRDLRRAAGLTQEELAERAGLAARTISDLERGFRRSPYKRTVELLAAALELDAEDQRRLLRAARRGATQPEVADPLVEAVVPAVAGIARGPVPSPGRGADPVLPLRVLPPPTSAGRQPISPPP